MRAAAIELSAVSPDSAIAQWCLAEYFAELDARFETGFDVAGESPHDAEMTPPNGFFVLALRDGRPVGCGGLRRIDERTGEIKRMWTAPAARGQGVARRILRKLEALARESGLRCLRLDTNWALVEAQSFYRREGYREIARYNDNPYANHWFEKEIEPAASAPVGR